MNVTSIIFREWFFQKLSYSQSKILKDLFTNAGYKFFKNFFSLLNRLIAYHWIFQISALLSSAKEGVVYFPILNFLIWHSLVRRKICKLSLELWIAMSWVLFLFPHDFCQRETNLKSADNSTQFENDSVKKWKTQHPPTLHQNISMTGGNISKI